MPERTRLEQRKWTTEEPDWNSKATVVSASAMQGKVHCSCTKLPGRESEREPLQSWMSETVAWWKPSPSADSPRTFWFKFPSEEFLAASASGWASNDGWAFFSIICPWSSSPLRRWQSGGGGQGSGVGGRWARTVGCGRGVFFPICQSCSGSTIGWLSTKMSTFSADVFTISPWSIIRGSLPLLSSSVSSSSSSSLSLSSSSTSSTVTSFSSASSSVLLSPSLSLSQTPYESTRPVHPDYPPDADAHQNDILSHIHWLTPR